MVSTVNVFCPLTHLIDGYERCKTKRRTNEEKLKLFSTENPLMNIKYKWNDISI